MDVLGLAWRTALVAPLLLGLSGCGLLASGGLLENNKAVGSCQTYELEGGPEDIAADPKGEYYFISATDWRGLRRSPQAKGVIYKAWFEGETLRLAAATGRMPANFHPHGIDLWVSPDGRTRRLFAISRPGGGQSPRVEVFEVDDKGALNHLPEETSPDLLSPNDLAAIDAHTYYVTNDQVATSDVGKLFENVFGSRSSYVSLVENGKVRPVAKAAFGNGVAVAGDRVYVVESALGVIRVYRRGADNGLTLLDSYKAGPGPDNLTLVGNELWYGGHSNGLRFLAHALKETTGSPSRIEVLDVTADPRDRKAHRIVFRSPGGKKGDNAASGYADAASVGVPVGKDRVMVGAIFQHQVRVCQRGDARP